MRTIVCMFVVVSPVILIAAAGRVDAGERRAVVVMARGGDAIQNDSNIEYCLMTKELLKASGFDDQHVRLLVNGGATAVKGSSDAKKNDILKHLDELSSVSKDDNELWLFLYGYADANPKGIFLATKEGRLSGEELSKALDRIPGRQFVFCLNQQSAGFMTCLPKKGRIVVTAADHEGQTNPPRLPKQLLSLWKDSPNASLKDLLVKAGAATIDYYKKSGLALAERPALFDGESLLEFPFEQAKTDNVLATASLKPDPSQKPLAAAADRTRPPSAIASPSEASPKASTARPSTAAEIALLEEAKKNVNNYKGFPSFTLKDIRQYLLEKDGSGIEKSETVTFLLKDVAAEKYGTLMFEDEPPNLETSIEQATVVLPDGTSQDVKPDIASGFGREKRLSLLKFDALRQGCLIIIKRKTVSDADAAIPFLQENIPLQSSEPVKLLSVAVSLPTGKEYQRKLYNSRAEIKESANDQSKTLRVEMMDVPALEPLPNDPPKDELLMRLRITSLKSWKEFEEWTRRIFKDADTLDDKTAALARSLAGGRNTDGEKLRAIYEFICELRYETTPIGVRALRPRKPGEVCSSLKGDCKEKANALVAMAKSLGIEGCFVLLNRMSATDIDFPCFQFNHAIAFFPKLDGYPQGLWCDATDGSTPFGALPPGDIGRQGLVFAKDGASFKTVTLPNGNTSVSSQEIILEPRPDGSVGGRFSFAFSGIPDYHLRRAIKRSTPRQANAAIQNIINFYLTGVSVTDTDFSPPEKLSERFTVSGGLSGQNWSYTRRRLAPCQGLWEALSSPTRDRPIVLNDGQPLVVEQKIIVKGDASPPLRQQWQQESDLLKTSVTISADGSTWTRLARLELTNGRIPQEAYQDVRRQLMEYLWKCEIP